MCFRSRWAVRNEWVRNMRVAYYTACIVRRLRHAGNVMSLEWPTEPWTEILDMILMSSRSSGRRTVDEKERRTYVHVCSTCICPKRGPVECIAYLFVLARLRPSSACRTRRRTTRREGHTQPSQLRDVRHRRQTTSASYLGAPSAAKGRGSYSESPLHSHPLATPLVRIQCVQHALSRYPDANPVSTK